MASWSDASSLVRVGAVDGSVNFEENYVGSANCELYVVVAASEVT